MRAKAKPEAEAVTAEMTGADVLIHSLKKENVEVLFGYPGGAVLPIYDALYRSPIKHVLSKHEQGSIHAAEGYARVSGKPGVVIATSGPGATNLVTGITDAMMDSLPLVIFTGQVASTVIGTDAFQEADIMGITAPITKHNYQVRDVQDLPRIIKEAFHIATTGRPGPVLVDIPKDVANKTISPDYDSTIHLPGYQPTFSPNILQIKKLADAVGSAKKPVILAGAGVLHANAGKELVAFSEKHSIPVINTLLGLGSYPGNHPLFLGMGGMHGTYTANMALYECDLLISIGARFDDRLTGNLDHFAIHATVAHIDVDPAEIGKNVPTQIPIVSDAREALKKLLEIESSSPETDNWRQKLTQNSENFPLWKKVSTSEFLPQRVVELVHEYTKGDAIITTDVGQHQMWAAQYYAFADANRWVTSGGLGTMGFGFPSAIGAQLAFPEQTVVSLTGDGGFQMTLQELSTLQELNLPVKVVIMNNQTLGMVRQWQEAFYEERYSQSLIPVQPDFVKLGEAYGIQSYKVTNEEEAKAVFEEAFSHRDPVLIDCRVSGKENVYPMIAPGKGLHQMIGVKP